MSEVLASGGVQQADRRLGRGRSGASCGLAQAKQGLPAGSLGGLGNRRLGSLDPHGLCGGSLRDGPVEQRHARGQAIKGDAAGTNLSLVAGEQFRSLVGVDEVACRAALPVERTRAPTHEGVCIARARTEADRSQGLALPEAYLVLAAQVLVRCPLLANFARLVPESSIPGCPRGHHGRSNVVFALVFSLRAWCDRLGPVEVQSFREAHRHLCRTRHPLPGPGAVVGSAAGFPAVVHVGWCRPRLRFGVRGDAQAP